MAELFPNIERTYDGPAAYSESHYHYLNRSARAPSERVRRLLELWLVRFPAAHRDDICQRLQLGDDAEFRSAFFELYLHELLVRVGYDVEVHPSLPDTTKRPDFRAISGEDDQLIVEAALATEVSTEQRGAEARLNVLYDIVDNIESPDFFLAFDVAGQPQSPLPATQWGRQLEIWLSDLDYELIAAIPDKGTLNVLPSKILRHDGLVLTARAIPKKPEARGKPNVRPIGAHSFEAVWVQSHVAIRDKIRAKASRYGRLNSPYVIAVNGIGEHCDQEELIDGLYGVEGLWPPGSSGHTRVSAVLATAHLFPWSVVAAPVFLCHNPSAAMRYSGHLCRLTQIGRDGTDIEIRDGVHPRSLFGLDERWPRDDAV